MPMDGGGRSAAGMPAVTGRLDDTGRGWTGRSELDDGVDVVLDLVPLVAEALTDILLTTITTIERMPDTPARRRAIRRLRDEMKGV